MSDKGAALPHSCTHVSCQPSEGKQIVLFDCPDLYHKPPDSGERQYKKTGSQGQNLVLTVLCVPHSLDGECTRSPGRKGSLGCCKAPVSVDKMSVLLKANLNMYHEHEHTDMKSLRKYMDASIKRRTNGWMHREWTQHKWTHLPAGASRLPKALDILA